MALGLLWEVHLVEMEIPLPPTVKAVGSQTLVRLWAA